MGNIKQLGLLGFAVLVMSIRMHGNIAMASWWIQGTEPAGTPSDYLQTFTALVPNEISCVRECIRTSFPCSLVSYGPVIQECQGYHPIRQHLRVTDNNKTIWTLVELPSFCRIHGYKFHPAFDTCIRMFNVKVTWFEADRLCRKDTAYLIVTDSLVKVAALTNAFPGLYGWVGLHTYITETKVRKFEWINGQYESANSSLWYPGEPSSPGYEQCVDIGHHTGRLNDNICSNKLAYMCQQDL